MTTQTPPLVVSDPVARRSGPTADEHGRRRSGRALVRGAGAFLGATLRVVLFGGEIKH